MSASELIDAFKAGDKRLAQRLLVWPCLPHSKRSDVSFKWFEQELTFPSLLYNEQVERVSLLHLAAYWGWKDIVVRIVTRLNDADAIKDGEGHIPLHYAAYNGHLDLVRYFITTRGYNPIAENKYDSTPLHLACSNGHLNVVQYLISEAHCNPSCVNSAGNTPLHYACRCGNLNIVQYLINEAHCNPSRENNYSNTPLHFACMNGHLNIVQYLIREAHCNSSCKNTASKKPLDYACINGHLNIVHYLVSEAHCNPSCVSSRGNTPLHDACSNGHLNIVHYLVSEAHCNPSCVSSRGNTPLHDACSNGHLNIVQYLISEVHCNPSCVSSRGNTPLHIACNKNHLDIVQYLISEAHCNPSCVDKNGSTPLHIACDENHLDIVKYLISEAHCNPSCVDKNGSTPLHIACDKNHLTIVRYLISEAHCNPSCVDKIGNTPLHNACINDHPNIVQYLLSEVHCNPSCRNNTGTTPLHIACMHDHAQIVRYLLSTNHVNPLAEDNIGHTPLYYATGKYNIFKLFQPFIDCSRDFPVHTFTKLILTGDGGAGKTTLAQLIKQASQPCSTTPESHNLFGRVRKMLQGGDRVAEVQHFTAGIVPHHVESEQLGNFVMYDFAGQQEYFSSHAAVLEQVMRRSAAMFVCMIDLSKSSEEISESLHYWLSFIENACSATGVKSHVAIVGSHADKAWFTKKKSSLLQEIAASRGKQAHQEYAGYTAMDCRRTNTPVSDRFISVLTDTHKAIAANQPAISFHCHLLYAFLHTRLDAIGCTLHDLILAISKEEDSSLPNDPSVLSELLTTLSDKGLLLFIQRPQSVSSWIVVKTEALLKEINGTLFAPHHFTEFRDLASNTGIIPASNLHKAFPKYNLEMLIGFLESLDFCRQIDPLLLQYTNLQTTPSHSTDNLLFFPGLVQSQRPNSLTKHGTLQFGWCLGCADPNQFFGSRFLHLLLLSVTYRFPLDIQIRASPSLHGLQRKCTIWKNGILWVNNDKITTVVEVIDRNRWVLVAMSCSEDRPVEHAKLRSALISLIRQLQQECWSSLKVCEFLVSPDLVWQYPFDSLPDTDLFAIKHVARSILLNKPTIFNQSNEFIKEILTQSLPLEPYQLISPSAVCDLFDTEKADQPVPTPLLQKVQEQICQFGRNPQVYEQLREYLNSMSIFAGRNPLEVAELKEEDILGVYSPTTGACGRSSILNVDANNVLYLLKKYKFNPASWGKLAIGLKLGSTADQIDKDYKGSDAQLTGLINHWVAMDTNKSWEKLVEAMEMSDHVIAADNLACDKDVGVRPAKQ